MKQGLTERATLAREREYWGAGEHQGAPLFVIPSISLPPSVFAPTDRTHWPVFNKAPVLGRFLSSSINCSRGVTQGREWVSEMESTRGRRRDGKEKEREAGRQGEIDLIRRWRKQWMRWKNIFSESLFLMLHTAENTLIEYETCCSKAASRRGCYFQFLLQSGTSFFFWFLCWFWCNFLSLFVLVCSSCCSPSLSVCHAGVFSLVN